MLAYVVNNHSIEFYGETKKMFKSKYMTIL